MKPMTDSSKITKKSTLIGQIIDPKQRDLGSLGVALLAAAKAQS